MKQFKLIRIHSDRSRVLAGEDQGFALDFPWIEDLLEANSRIGFSVSHLAVIPPFFQDGAATNEGFLFLLERDAPPESGDTPAEEDEDTEEEESEEPLLTDAEKQFLLETDRLPPHAKLAIASHPLSGEDLAALCDALCPPSLR